MNVARTGDGWVETPQGRFWGKFGAAGLMVLSPDGGSILLQERVSWSHHGGTWGIPGGARDANESVIHTALREAVEEAAVPVQGLDLRWAWVRSVGQWSYTTVLAQSREDFAAQVADRESASIRWVPLEEVPQLALHPGFASSWQETRKVLTPVGLVIDAANVLGSRPTGWWRDRQGATSDLLARVQRWAQGGVSGTQFGLEPTALWPQVRAVVEGKARGATADGGPLQDPAAGGDFQGTAPLLAPRNQVQVVQAPGAGDDAIVELTRPGDRVVTADRELRARVLDRGGTAVGPGWLWEALETAAPGLPPVGSATE